MDMTRCHSQLVLYTPYTVERLVMDSQHHSRFTSVIARRLFNFARDAYGNVTIEWVDIIKYGEKGLGIFGCLGTKIPM